MRLSKGGKITLRVVVALVLAFIYIPLLVIAVEAFNSSRILKWPPPGFTLSWFGKALENESVREALLTSIEAGLAAMLIAIVLGTLIALAVGRRRFFGRDSISFLVVLPIALPGIVTGVALSNTFTQVLGISLSLLTVIIGHATFCIVVVYNNAVARLRRTSGSFEEASADLGADPWQTFRWVTFPSLRSALGAGALLAFALSFDEIIVTNFTIGAGEETLPIWIYRNLFRPKELPVVPAVAVILIIPVYLAHRLSSDDAGLTPGRGGGATTTPAGIAETEATSAHRRSTGPRATIWCPRRSAVRRRRRTERRSGRADYLPAAARGERGGSPCRSSGVHRGRPRLRVAQTGTPSARRGRSRSRPHRLRCRPRQSR
jgi:putative spermidine/putrescine transport system permease protein